ncbi:MAG: efflux RND transporter periplasmic adaptor subunit [Verrucomicrobiota bacterium]
MLLFRHVSFYLGLIGLAGALLLVRRQAAQPPDPGPASPPARSPFEERVAATGLIESARENVRVAAPRPGLVTRVFGQVGDDVPRGAPLFQLDDRETRARVAALEAQRAARTAELAVEETLVADWTDQLERVTRLQASQVATEEELRRRQFGLRAAQARVQAGRAGIAAVQAQLEQARTELGILTVTAPRQGRLLQVNVREGEYAPASANANTEPLMLLGDVATLQVRAEVDEQNAVLVSADQPAEASLKGRVDLKIPLRFVRIEPYVVPKRSLTGDSLERVDTRVLQVIFAFDRPAFPVYVGQQVDVFIRRPAALASRQP